MVNAVQNGRSRSGRCDEARYGQCDELVGAVAVAAAQGVHHSQELFVFGRDAQIQRRHGHSVSTAELLQDVGSFPVFFGKARTVQQDEVDAG